MRTVIGGNGIKKMTLKRKSFYQHKHLYLTVMRQEIMGERGCDMQQRTGIRTAVGCVRICIKLCYAMATPH